MKEKIDEGGGYGSLELVVANPDVRRRRHGAEKTKKP